MRRTQAAGKGPIHHRSTLTERDADFMTVLLCLKVFPPHLSFKDKCLAIKKRKEKYPQHSLATLSAVLKVYNPQRLFDNLNEKRVTLY